MSSPIAFRRVGLVGKCSDPSVFDALLLLARLCADQGLTVYGDRDSLSADRFDKVATTRPWQVVSLAEMASAVDLAIAVGGDGTMLRAARYLPGVPLVGVNRGLLGFMTDIGLHEIESRIRALLAGDYQLERRLMLAARICRDDDEVGSGIALNDVVLVKGGHGRLIELQLYVDDSFVFNLRADGLITATPTGSTAYALSAGGPIVMPHLPTMALVPLCAHGLSNRPVLIGAEAEIRIDLMRGQEACVHLDGQETFRIDVGHSLRIKKAATDALFLHPTGYRYFDMLRDKLNLSEALHVSTNKLRRPPQPSPERPLC